jgi:hypothetical protein
MVRSVILDFPDGQVSSMITTSLNRAMQWPALITLTILASTTASALSAVVPEVSHVHNGPEAPRERAILDLEELWRVGDDEDDMIFGLITRVAADEHGRIFILDSQLCEVHVFSPQGVREITLFRRGEGPGELTRPRDLCLLGDGSVGVAQEMPGRLIRVDRRNNPLPSVEIDRPGEGGFEFLNSCWAGGPTLLVGAARAGRRENGVQKRTAHLTVYTLAGSPLTCLASRDYERDFNDFVFAEKNEMPIFWWATAVDESGRIYTVPDRDRYVIEVFSPQGDLERVIEREYRPVPRTPRAQDRLREAVGSIFEGTPFNVRVEIERDECAILPLQRGLRVRGDGSLWVLPGRGITDQLPGVMMTFDVFDEKGRFDHQVSVRGRHDAARDGFFFVGEDRAIVITGYVAGVFAQYTDGGSASTYDGEDEAMQVICYACRASADGEQ